MSAGILARLADWRGSHLHRAGRAIRRFTGTFGGSVLFVALILGALATIGVLAR